MSKNKSSSQAGPSKRIKTSHSSNTNGSSQSGQESCGKIQSIRLKNIMCHTNFEFELGEKINFISGKNGSGKSAILTALVIGLGGRTTDTNRGKALKEIIKNGENKGSIEIKLSNSGPLAYEPERFGEFLTISRTINETSSSYKLIPSRGAGESLTSKELKMIMLRFNIQVTNPVCILNQDTSRTFLKSATPKELYSLFKKATLLDSVWENISSLKNERIPSIRTHIQKDMDIVNNVSKDLVEYQEALKLYRKLEALEAEEANWKNHLHWAYVKELEDKLKTVEKSYQENESAIEKLRDYLNNGESRREQLNARNELLQREMQKLKDDCDAKDAETNEFQQKLSYHRGLINKKTNELTNLKKQISNYKRNCDQLAEEIENRTKRSEEIKEKRAMVEQQINDFQKRSNELKAVKQTTEVHKQQLQDTLNKTSTSIENVKSLMANIERNIATKKGYLQHLKNSSSKYTVFAQWMPELLTQINNASQRQSFVKKPIGPIGSFMKLKDKTWGPAIESLFGSQFLKSFCVHCDQDYRTLTGILNQLNIPAHQRPSIHITKHLNEVHDVSQTETGHNRYVSALRVLDISSPVVTNLIIDMYKADTVLLIPTSKEAFPLMDNSQRAPRKCKMVLTKDGDIIKPYPNYSFYSGQAQVTKFLEVSAEDAIKTTEEELSHLSRDMENHKSNLKALYVAKKEQQSNLDVALKEHNKLNRQIITCDEKLNELREEDLPGSYDINILSDDLKHRKGLIAKNEENIQKIEREKEETMKVCEEMEAGRRELEEVQRNFFAQISAKEKEVRENKIETNKYNLTQDKHMDLLKRQESACKQTKEKMEKIQDELKWAVAAAEESCQERINSELPRATIEMELKKSSAKRAAMENHLGPKLPEPRRFKERMAEFESTIQKIAQHLQYCQELEQQAHDLELCYKKTLKLVSDSTKRGFKVIMRLKNVEASLIINDEKETLELKLQTADSQSNSVITTLSGGERSFAMVAFIVSLWNNMESPFFLMDEFDVFMDEVNRKLIMELLMNYARSMPNKQFVFLTPHATYEENARDVHFFRMADPRK